MVARSDYARQNRRARKACFPRMMGWKTLTCAEASHDWEAVATLNQAEMSIADCYPPTRRLGLGAGCCKSCEALHLYLVEVAKPLEVKLDVACKEGFRSPLIAPRDMRYWRMAEVISTVGEVAAEGFSTEKLLATRDVVLSESYCTGSPRCFDVAEDSAHFAVGHTAKVSGLASVLEESCRKGTARAMQLRNYPSNRLVPGGDVPAFAAAVHVVLRCFVKARSRGKNCGA